MLTYNFFTIFIKLFGNFSRSNFKNCCKLHNFVHLKLNKTKFIVLNTPYMKRLKHYSKIYRVNSHKKKKKFIIAPRSS